MGAAPALAKGTAGVELAGEAERATATKPEALVPWANDKAVRGREMVPQEMPTEGERGQPGCCKTRC